MKTLALLAAMVKADLLERTRRTSFLITACLIIYLGYAVNTGQVFIKLETYRGIYNSAWVGSLMAMVITFFLGLAGFYLVKNTIAHDERTGVGQIIATTPLTRPQYLLGKWLSNFTVLALLVGILALAAILMQLLSREDPQIHLWALLAPLLFIALPMMALVAAIAVCFESVSWLKGGFGNLAYFGVFLALFMAGIFLPDWPWLDVTGFSVIGSSMRAAARAAFPTYGDAVTLSMASEAAVTTFVYPGVDWSVRLIFQRLMWFAVSAGLVLVSAVFFQRFDPHQRAAGRKQKAAEPPAPLENQAASPAVVTVKSLTPLPVRRPFRMNFLRLVWLEGLLLIKGLKWYWWLGMALLWIGGLFGLEGIPRQMWFTVTTLWPVLIWSRMGERETRCHTEQVIYQAAYPLLRLQAAAWLAGVILTGLLFSGVLIGRWVGGASLDLLPWGLSVLFVPTLALALGSWSRSSKLFEVVYPILWYLGPFNRENGLAVIDYLGIHPQAPVNTAPLLFAGVILGCLGLAFVGRRQQMRMA